MSKMVNFWKSDWIFGSFPQCLSIFDIEECSVSRTTAEFLNFCQKKGIVVNVSNDMPKSFIVTEKNVFISNVSNRTIALRAREN